MEAPNILQEKPDIVYLIDNQLNLFKLRFEAREQCRVLSKINLTTHKNIEDAMEAHVRDKNFSRISVTD